MRVAYFCAEFGLSADIPIYAGGLGILAGDHLKAASDLGIPLVGIGLFYYDGYFQQRSTRPDSTSATSSAPAPTRRGACSRDDAATAADQRRAPDRTRSRDHLAPDGRFGDAPAAGRQHPRERTGRARDHRTALWWRSRDADPPGAPAGHRRYARARRRGDQPRRCFISTRGTRYSSSWSGCGC